MLHIIKQHLVINLLKDILVYFFRALLISSLAVFYKSCVLFRGILSQHNARA